ncbi:alpha/beta hydrolase [Kaarinaea lacus]
MSLDFNDSAHGEPQLYDSLKEAPCAGENFLIPGPAGVMEAVMSCAELFLPGDPIAVICHPHPLHGGSMTNKVVHIVSKTFKEMGVPNLRFNFRGVGHSQGHFDQGEGEVDDLAAAVEWFKQRYPDSPVWLAGFSFGSFIAYKAHERVHAERLLLIAPPVTWFDFSTEAQIHIPWMVIQGGKDEITPPEKVSSWVNKQSNKPDYQWFDDASHFFHGRLNRIRDAIRVQWG